MINNNVLWNDWQTKGLLALIKKSPCALAEKLSSVKTTIIQRIAKNNFNYMQQCFFSL